MATQTKQKPVKLNVRKGDQVVVISGKSRDRKTPRTVLRTLPQEGKVVVEGVNLVKDTPNKRTQAGQAQQGIIEKPMPIDVSNVMLLDPKTNTPTRVRRVKGADGKIQRVSVKSGEVIS